MDGNFDAELGAVPSRGRDDQARRYDVGPVQYRTMRLLLEKHRMTCHVGCSHKNYTSRSHIGSRKTETLSQQFPTSVALHADDLASQVIKAREICVSLV